VEQLVDVLGSLVDKSFVVRSEQADGELRLSVLETVREYGLACLHESGEGAQQQQRHADYFRALAQEAEPHLSGAEQLTWLHRLEQEHDNLRAALQWLLESDQVTLALHFESALASFWMMRNHMSEGHRWLEKALTDSRDVPSSIRARALLAAAFCFYQEENSRAVALFEESLKLFRQLEDRPGMAQALNGLGHTSLAQHRYDVLQDVSEENLQLAREIGDDWKMAEAFFLSAYAYLAQGDQAKHQEVDEGLD
jgi:non-specific serine/threonine protein kinase